jgi:hypothetical protein
VPRTKAKAVNYPGALSVPIEWHLPPLNLTPEELEAYRQHEKLRVAVERMKKMDLLIEHLGITELDPWLRMLKVALELADVHVPGFRIINDTTADFLKANGKNRHWTPRQREWLLDYVTSIQNGFPAVTDRQIYKCLLLAHHPELGRKDQTSALAAAVTVLCNELSRIRRRKRAH